MYRSKSVGNELDQKTKERIQRWTWNAMQLAMERAQLMKVSRMEICIGNPMIEYLLQQAFKNIEMTNRAANMVGKFVADLKQVEQEIANKKATKKPFIVKRKQGGLTTKKVEVDLSTELDQLN